MDLGITGRTALISGGSGDIGLATAKQLAEEGVKLVLTDLDQDALDQAVHSLPAGTVGVAADLSTADGVEQLRGQIDQDIDILVNAAGVTGAKGDPLDPTEDDWEHALQIDFMSCVRMSKAFVPAMAERGWGRVIFVTSENVSQSYPDEVVYNASKSATLSFAKGLSQPYAPKGVLVNCVAPAFIKTNMTDGMMEKRSEELGVSTERAVESFLEEERPYLVLKRRGRPEEVAAVIAFLVSELSSFVVGSSYRVDGGAVIGMDI
jgi:NAD(P)-dependent dehydrogenase (short-subunit alcohol dehydrogenase family)